MTMADASRRRTLQLLAAGAAGALLPGASRAQSGGVQGWPLHTDEATGIHDVAPAPDHGVWFTAQRSGHLGWWDTHQRRAEMIALGRGSKPHGVIQGPDKAAWVTDGGQNAIVRVGWPERSVKIFPLPAGTPNANLNTAAFDGDGNLWFTGQAGYVGKLEVATGKVTVREAPRGPGPYGICATPKGDIWWCSLAQSFIARIDRRTGESTIVEPPTRDQGARRVWSDSAGRLFVSEWLSGNLSMHDPATGAWKTWKVPGTGPKTYAVYVDERDHAWVSEWSGNAIYRFDPKAETFQRFALPRPYANVRQIHGRPGEIWLPESGTEHISVIRT
jgi:virginiamycin B lyase